MAGNILDDLFNETSSNKKNLEECTSQTGMHIQNKKIIENAIEALRRQIEQAEEEIKQAEEEIERLTAMLNAIQDDDDDDNSGAASANRRAQILVQIQAAQRRKQEAEKKKKEAEEEYYKKRKKLQEEMNYLAFLRVRLRNLNDLFESLQRKFNAEAEKNSEAKNRFQMIGGQSRFGSRSAGGIATAEGKIGICKKGFVFCDKSKAIINELIQNIDQETKGNNSDLENTRNEVER